MNAATAPRTGATHAGGLPVRQPSGLYLLFATEMWERFSYYGMRALLILFLIDHEAGGWGWSREAASRLYGWYTGLVYLTPMIGGYLADRYLGTHRALVIGGLIIAAGHFSLALPWAETFYIGLACIVIGTGFFKSNVSTMVGQLYGPEDQRRDAGFTIFYMGINLGALLGPLLCGLLRTTVGWHYGFAAAGVGMVLGLLVYVSGKRRFLGDIGDVPSWQMLEADGRKVMDAPLTTAERQRVAAIFIVSFFVIFFWMAFEQAGSSMNIFADERTNRSLAGYTFPAEWFQSVNPAAILIFAPLFASMWMRLGARGLEPSTPAKMASGLLLLGAGFVFMVFGARQSDAGGLVSPLWLIAAYLFHTWGELCLSPVGLSLVTQLAPLKFASLLMGVWFLANFAANVLSGYIAGAVERVERGEVFVVLGGQADFFLMFVISSVLVGLLFFGLTPRITRLMYGRAG